MEETGKVKHLNKHDNNVSHRMRFKLSDPLIPVANDELGPTQMTNQMVTDFENTWQIVTHIPNPKQKMKVAIGSVTCMALTVKLPLMGFPSHRYRIWSCFMNR